MPFDRSEIGSVGHLVGASMETAGQYLQSMLLDSFTSGFGVAVGCAFFVISAVSAIFLLVTAQNPKPIQMSVIGTSIFLFLIYYRTPSTGADWTFGFREYPNKLVEEGVENIVSSNSSGIFVPPANDQQTNNPPASVSWFFSVWNRLVSGAVRSVISLIEFISKNGDLSFVVKTDRYNALFSPKTSDSTLRHYLTAVIVPHCADYFILAKEYNYPGVSSLRRDELKASLKIKGAAPVMTGADRPEVIDWLDQKGILPMDIRLMPKGEIKLSCDQLWTMGVKAFTSESAKFVETIIGETRTEGATTEDVRNQLAEKFATQIDGPNGNMFKLDPDQKFFLMINEVAARMMMTELTRTHPNSIEVDYGPSIPVEEGGMISDMPTGANIIRQMVKVDEAEEKGDFLMAMLALPYVQGMALFFLAFMFPFFACCCVLSGRHTAVLTWMGLWLWIKLWDVGFAVVMVVDNILYQLLPHGPPVDAKTLSTPWDTMKAILSVDPTYATYTYYHVLATLIAAVPVLTGWIVKKSGGDFVDMVGGGLNNFSGRIGGAIGSYSRSLAVQSQQHEAAKYTYANMKQALSQARFDPIVRASKARAAFSLGEAAVNAAYGPGSVAAAAAANAETHLGIGKAQIGKIGAYSEYGSITSPYTDDLAITAVSQLFNSHNVKNPVAPGDAQNAFFRSMYYNPVADAADAILAGGYSIGSQLNNGFAGQAPGNLPSMTPAMFNFYRNSHGGTFEGFNKILNSAEKSLTQVPTQPNSTPTPERTR